MKKLLLTIILIGLSLPFADKADAQWSIGASYEVRDENPTNGFGLRVERGILNMVPIVDFDMRAHFSYFSETNEASLAGATISQEFESYDFGIAVTAGVKVAMVKPYVGFGLGSETFDFSSDDNQSSFSEDNFYWNGFGGLELRLLPLLNPFIEYRITNLTSPDEVDFDNVGRIAFGINLRF